MLIHHKFVSDGCKFPLLMILLIFILRSIIGLVQRTKYKVLSAYHCNLDFGSHDTREVLRVEAD